MAQIWIFYHFKGKYPFKRCKMMPNVDINVVRKCHFNDF